MLRLSVTHLEALRYHKSRDDSSLAELLARIAGVDPPNRKMLAGKALAKFFEDARPDTLDSAVVDGWRFNFALDAAIDLPDVREMKIEEVFDTPSGMVTLVGKVDGFHGLTVRDQKLTDALDVEGKYTDSLQWRAYLTMLGARRFIYDVFVGSIDEHEDVVTIHEYHPVPFYSYPNMRADVEQAVCELAEVVAANQEQINALKAQKAA